MGVKKEADNKKEQLAPARLVKRQYLAMLMAIVFAALIFVFDYLMSLGVAGGVPYAAVVLVGFAVRSPLAVLLFAGLGTLLTVAGLLLSPDPVAPFNIVITNRVLALFAIWSTAGVSFFHLRLSATANQDQLTGAYNRDYFIAKAWEQIKIWRRYRMPLTLIVLDIESLKKINREYGYVAGDRVLKHIARLLQLHTREVDIVCRYGGDEFAILLPMIDLEGALAAARRIQQTVSTSSVRWGSRNLRPSVNMGVVELLNEQWDFEVLMAEAGKALERAKISACDKWGLSVSREPKSDKTGSIPSCKAE